MFDKVDEIQVLQIEKELISLDTHSFDKIEEYLAHAKEIQLKLWKCENNFLKKYGQLIELVLMILRTHYDVFCSPFSTNWISHKEDGKDCTFDVFCDLLIKDQQKFINEGKLVRKN